MATLRSFGAEARRDALLETLRSDGGVRLEAAAEQLGVSVMTVRRDLDELDAAGLARRVRGGAVPVAGARPFSERRGTGRAAKTRIAEKAAQLLPGAGSIAVDASTTAGGLAAHLAPSGPLTIATNSYENFAAITSTSEVSAILIGGELDERTGSFVGLIACQAAQSMLYSRFFASAYSLDAPNGSSEVSLAESQVKRAFAERAREIVLLVDSSKLGQQALAVGFAWHEIGILVTELDPADSALEPYRDLVELL
ncbi:transcriptional regulator, DeoR family [Agreia bicolorata]|uniref:DeoR faimly transcriptional regulator n=1 Tax=Agreia bicolorata TaxID=110935 RepID=A0A1T4WS93_9MICO|nr:DeoR/GlpR family DNA-binding transcription regulator [Agreia bicolorata]KJC64251.1 DeoR faimly transcriptional regulator [Agreia bicolorata]SKA79987.1 transcriptional regulator, DeoR family [Agreia bicolorata]